MQKQSPPNMGIGVWRQFHYIIWCVTSSSLRDRFWALFFFPYQTLIKGKKELIWSQVHQKWSHSRLFWNISPRLMRGRWIWKSISRSAKRAHLEPNIPKMEPFLIELKFLPQANSRLLNLKIKVLTCSFGAKFTRNVATSSHVLVTSSYALVTSNYFPITYCYVLITSF